MKTSTFLIGFFVLLSAAFLSYYYYAYKQHPRQLPVAGQPGHTVGAFSFINQNGKTFTDKDVANKIYIVEYFFTTCQGICPKMNDNMVNVYKAFRKDKDVLILSHTVDPLVDTAEQLKRYSLKYDADDSKWIFLTGSKDSLYKMAVDDYLIPIADSNVEKISPKFIHTQKFVLVDKDKRIRGFYDGTDESSVQQLIGDIKELEKEYHK